MHSIEQRTVFPGRGLRPVTIQILKAEKDAVDDFIALYDGIPLRTFHISIAVDFVVDVMLGHRPWDKRDPAIVEFLVPRRIAKHVDWGDRGSRDARRELAREAASSVCGEYQMPFASSPPVDLNTLADWIGQKTPRAILLAPLGYGAYGAASALHTGEPILAMEQACAGTMSFLVLVGGLFVGKALLDWVNIRTFSTLEEDSSKKDE